MLLKIGILLQDLSIAEDIARRLAEISDRLEINCMKPGIKAKREGFDIVIDEETDTGMPISRLFEQMVSEYTDRTGRHFFIGKREELKVITVHSETGGSGVSSISILLARNFAGRSGKKVLLIDTVRGGSGYYVEAEFSPRRGEAELVYRLSSRRQVNLNDYIYRDKFGADILGFSGDAEELLTYIDEYTEYELVIICHSPEDAGKTDIRLNVINEMDSRSHTNGAEATDFNDEDICLNEAYKPHEIRVINRSKYGGAAGDVFCIADDEASFTREGKKVKISQQGEFSIGVERLYAALRETLW